MSQIPPRHQDLRRYVRKNDLRRILLYLAWILIFFGGAMAYNQNHQTYPPDRLMTGWRLLGWMAIALVSGFFLFRIWKLFLHPTYRGEVIRTGLAHTYAPGEEPNLSSKTNYDFRLKTTLLIRLPNGKKRRLRFEQKPGSYLYYREGMSLIRYRGLPYPINPDPTSPNGYVCVACGRIHEHLQKTCEECGLSLIDPRELQ